MSSEPLSGTYSEIADTWMRASLAIHTLLRREYAGQSLDGQEISVKIKRWPNNRITDITVTVSCVRSWGMAQTTEVSQLP